jgi:hypothetical protein
MFSRQREQWAEPQIIAIVELDTKKIRVRIVLAREAIRQRLRELEHLTAGKGKPQGIEQANLIPQRVSKREVQRNPLIREPFQLEN